MNKTLRLFSVITLGILFFLQISINFPKVKDGFFPTISVNVSGAFAQDAEPVDKIYEGAPNGEINYSLMEYNKKMCFNSFKTKEWNSCEDHPYQSCPGMSFAPEPSCTEV